ncbi:MAG TPA: hypothetical protein VF789_31020 [Thermoanaerobaculia bacterium]
MKKKALERDPIVEEIHKVRREYSSQFNSFEEMFQDLVRRQEERGRPVVSFAAEGRRRKSK